VLTPHTHLFPTFCCSVDQSPCFPRIFTFEFCPLPFSLVHIKIALLYFLHPFHQFVDRAFHSFSFGLFIKKNHKIHPKMCFSLPPSSFATLHILFRMNFFHYVFLCDVLNFIIQFKLKKNEMEKTIKKLEKQLKRMENSSFIHSLFEPEIRPINAFKLAMFDLIASLSAFISSEKPCKTCGKVEVGALKKLLRILLEICIF
jgi:hypothetical protein